MSDEFQGYDYDLLLEYLSRKKTDTYQNFRKYVVDLNYDLTLETYDNDPIKFKKKKDNFIRKTRKMLSRLGHAEFIFGKERQFMIAPSVISLLPNSCKGVLCGYRTEELLEDLQSCCDELEIEYIEDEENNIDAPKVIFIDFRNKENINLFEHKLDKYENIKDIKIVENFSKKVLQNVPKVIDIINDIEQGNDNFQPTKDELDTDNMYFFNSKNLTCVQKKFIPRANWGDADDNWVVREQKYPDNTSLYYLKYEKDGKENYYLIDKHYGMLVNIYKNKKNCLVYWSDGNLRKKARFLIFPELIDRALTLASGYNPSDYVYKDIDRELAKLLEDVTGLDIKYEEE